MIRLRLNLLLVGRLALVWVVKLGPVKGTGSVLGLSERKSLEADGKPGSPPGIRLASSRERGLGLGHVLKKGQRQATEVSGTAYSYFYSSLEALSVVVYSHFQFCFMDISKSLDIFLFYMFRKLRCKSEFCIHYNCKFSSCISWDTAGQERFKCIAASYYRGASGEFPHDCRYFALCKILKPLNV